MELNSSLGSSHHGPPHTFKDAGLVVDSLTGIHNAIVKCLFIVNPVDSNLASVEAM
jgi:hypothetical protein